MKNSIILMGHFVFLEYSKDGIYRSNKNKERLNVLNQLCAGRKQR
ncbi:hypothetical protein [Leptospira weilii]|nr:hypothetical protein [Leptospira weilii]